ncbi:hypothetical protein [Polymorphobacter megasporae]|uniref:hypothetical protein n=1 Tax=Glacieibacterium megasporae TaxID=2835787 RepID=UPI001C1E61B6|nr:hypothetical protein [Polymorphobacter megasporae]UAJ11788.1 hypothetical protein KTC28_09080 [Polymorphobacter megasporae]
MVIRSRLAARGAQVTRGDAAYAGKHYRSAASIDDALATIARLALEPPAVAAKDDSREQRSASRHEDDEVFYGKIFDRTEHVATLIVHRSITSIRDEWYIFSYLSAVAAAKLRTCGR